ncbi:MAG: MarR family winged helix-turn-helix transcriptional regulator, partial [Stellaceae bacterium]
MSKTADKQIAAAGVDRATCLCFHAQRAARSLARRFDEEFRSVGLTNGQYSLLAALDQTGPVGIGGLAEALGMDRTTLTAALKPLTRQGRV